MSILAFIPLIGSILDPLGRIGHLIAQARLQEVQAGTEKQRIEAHERVRALELRQAELARDPWSPHIRLGFALPFVLYNGKLIVWDKLLGWGVTDPLSPELAAVQMAVIGFYFLHTLFARR